MSDQQDPMSPDSAKSTLALELEQHLIGASHALRQLRQRGPLQTINDAGRETLWNALNNASFMASELANLLQMPERRSRGSKTAQTPTRKKTKAPKGPRPSLASLSSRASSGPRAPLGPEVQTSDSTKRKRAKRTKRSKPYVPDGYCEGCEQYKTGAQAVNWRKGDIKSHDEETGVSIRQKLCNACGLQWQRRQRATDAKNNT